MTRFGAFAGIGEDAQVGFVLISRLHAKDVSEPTPSGTAGTGVPAIDFCEVQERGSFEGFVTPMDEAAGIGREPELKKEVVVELLRAFSIVGAETNGEDGLRRRGPIIRRPPSADPPNNQP